jgi:hypothetical protein
VSERVPRERPREETRGRDQAPGSVRDRPPEPAAEPKKLTRAREALDALPAGTPATPAERGFAECPCTEECVLHGSCLLCAAYHGRKNRLPRCDPRR